MATPVEWSTNDVRESRLGSEKPLGSELTGGNDMSDTLKRCPNCGGQFDSARHANCPLCASKATTTAAKVRSTSSTTSARTDVLILQELKSQSAMLRTITRIMVTFSVLAGLGLIYLAVSISNVQ